jgi:uncharacterized iron-regulated protein
MFVKRVARQRKQAAAVLALLACATTVTAGEGLAGRIWAPSEQAFVDADRVEAAVADADYALLGETHTIARHHRLQARLLAAAARERRPAVVLEMVARDTQAAIDAWRSAGAEPERFGKAVDWSQRGWPEWAIYQPIVEVAVARDLPIRAGAPSAEIVRRVGQEGLQRLPAQRRRSLGLDKALPDAADERLRKTLKAAHCGSHSAVPIDRMVAVQRLRDAHMAERMRASGDGGAMLIAGNGHTRRDFGVGPYLSRQASTVSVALIGAPSGDTLASVREAHGGALAFDFVWFTDDEPPRVTCPGDGEGDHG